MISLLLVSHFFCGSRRFLVQGGLKGFLNRGWGIGGLHGARRRLLTALQMGTQRMP